MKQKSPKFPVLSKLSDALMDVFNNLTDDEMIALEKECETATETNCWWIHYDVAKSLERIVKSKVDQLNRRNSHDT